MNQLTDKVTLITGGGSGIGLATARLFLEEGARVAITGRNAEKLDQAAKHLGGGDRLIAKPADAAQPDQVHELVQFVNDRFGRIHILVNNAGGNIKERTFRDLTPERWKAMLDANLHSGFYTIREVLPQMLEARDGLVVQINSIAGKRGSPLGGPAYSAAKFGLRGLAMSIAAEERESGVRFSNIYPGEVDTPILEARPTPVTEEHRQSILQPEDVARAILFVAALPPRAAVPELVIAPVKQLYV
jgi:NAD(P)-dependent dehydrogenase (short-subunit alcohol dehydrogenase family)